MGEELAHHGILGMHWGVRRTPAELGHAPKGEKSSGSDSKDQKKNPAAGKHSKSVSKMSDEELRSRINRLNMEKQYKDLLAAQNPQKKSVVKKLLGEAFENLGRRTLGLAVDAFIAKIDPNNKDDDFDINDFKDKDVYDMDMETIEKVNKWYKNAASIETNRKQRAKAEKEQSKPQPKQQKEESKPQPKQQKEQSKPQPKQQKEQPKPQPKQQKEQPKPQPKQQKEQPKPQNKQNQSQSHSKVQAPLSKEQKQRLLSISRISKAPYGPSGESYRKKSGSSIPYWYY